VRTRPNQSDGTTPRAWPRISVVVCSYNGARTIRDTLDGLGRVDYPDFEVIVVDDGSTDHVSAIVADYPVRLIRTENRGLSSARNTGCEAATGEIVAYVDDDAWPDPHWLRYLAIAYRKGDVETAFARLRKSVELDDNLPYDEPWAWMQPPRHALGALLLEQGHVVEAAQVYRADLGLDETLVRPSQHMGNVWSLHGYAECCRRLGHGDEAAAMELHLAQAQAVADIPIHASCFCRQVPENCEELHGSA